MFISRESSRCSEIPFLVKNRFCLVVCVILSLLSMVSGHPAGFGDEHDYSVKIDVKDQRWLYFTDLEFAKFVKVFRYCFIEWDVKKRDLEDEGGIFAYKIEKFLGDFSSQHVEEDIFYHIDIENVGDTVDKEGRPAGFSLKVSSTIENRVSCRKALLGARSVKNRVKRENNRDVLELEHERKKYSKPKQHLIKV